MVAEPMAKRAAMSGDDLRRTASSRRVVAPLYDRSLGRPCCRGRLRPPPARFLSVRGGTPSSSTVPLRDTPSSAARSCLVPAPAAVRAGLSQDGSLNPARSRLRCSKLAA